MIIVLLKTKVNETHREGNKKQNLGSLPRLGKIWLMSQSGSQSNPYYARKKKTYVQVAQHTPHRNNDLGFSCHTIKSRLEELFHIQIHRPE